MTSFKIDAKDNLLKFPTVVSPFIFKESKELVEKMLKEGNSATKADRKIVKSFFRGMNNGCNICCGILAGMTLIGIPFYFCYLNKKSENSRKANNRIIKIWEETAKKYNEELAKFGVFARLVNFDLEAGYVNINKCSFEFSFNYPLEIRNLNALAPEVMNLNANGNAINMPAPINYEMARINQEDPVK